MVLVQASNLNLPNPSFLSSSSPHKTTSLLYEPTSHSLALIHSDSSLSLYPSLSPLSSLSTTKTLIPPPSSSSSFLLLHHQNPNPKVLFLVSSPHRSGSQILLKFYVLQKSSKSNGFVRARVVCSQKGVQIDDKVGVLLDINHGVCVKLVGSVNYFALYSLSNAKIWVFAVKLVGGGGDGDENVVVVKLMRCCVIECCRPVWEIKISHGLMVLGEENGVRVLNFRQLVKGMVKKVKKLGKGSMLPNGLIGDYGCGQSASEVACNGYLDGGIDDHSVLVKQRFVVYGKDSSEGNGCFVAFKREEADYLKAAKVPLLSVKAISIEALSPMKFLVLDSFGDLHVLHVPKPLVRSNLTCHMKQLPLTMKVQKLAFLQDISSRLQTVWLSDGSYSVHMITLSDMDTAVNEDDRKEYEETQSSVVLAIFASEKIQDIVPLAANGVLILGQGSLFAYAIS